MNYIKLEDVQKILESKKFKYDGTRDAIGMQAISKINSLPSINPEEIIKKEIEKIKTANRFETDVFEIDALKELLQKFKS